MKIGDILINRWAGHVDTRYFIYLGIDEKYVKGIEYADRKWKRVNYYKSDMEQLKPDGMKAYEVVGHTNFLDIAKADLQIFKEMEGKENEKL